MMAMPALSIVSGTYNRLSYLQNMINSARRALPLGLPYEFVIIDAGSDDGSLEWLRQQPDVVLIEHGEKRGAIAAFTEGAYRSRGLYVLLANDDVTFHPHSITRAISYLEDHPHCGAVAFADNRPSRHFDNRQFKTEVMAGVTPEGRAVVVTYAQVGLFRKRLGDAVGWWGAYDPIMSRARTYGGDNYLSARIWEAGYTVDAVPGVAVTDHIPVDQLRRANMEHEQGKMHPDSAAFLERFPRWGPEIGKNILRCNVQARKLRILYLPIYEPGYPQQRYQKRGLRIALKKLGFVYEVDYLNTDVNVAEVVKAWQPHLMLSQFQDATNVTPDMLAYWRKLCPGMVVVNWNGDARGLLEPDYLSLLRRVDLQLIVNAAALPEYEREGIRAAYWQIGFERPAGKLPEMPAHDVVFLGNAYNEQRHELERALRSNGHNVGLYGSGWQQADGNTLYDFGAGEALYRNATIAVSDTFPGTVAFVSNRLFQALAAGAFVLHQETPQLEEYTGLVAGKHYVEWRDLDDLRERICYWMDKRRKKRRQRIAQQGHEFVVQNYSFDAQVRKLLTEHLPKLLMEARRDPA